MEARKDDHYFECPHCGYRITALQRELARFDYGCPRCGKKQSEFVRKDYNKPAPAKGGE